MLGYGLAFGDAEQGQVAVRGYGAVMAQLRKLRAPCFWVMAAVGVPGVEIGLGEVGGLAAAVWSQVRKFRAWMNRCSAYLRALGRRGAVAALARCGGAGARG